MRGASQFVRQALSRGNVSRFLAVVALAVAGSAISAAQFGGPPTKTQIHGQQLAPPPSVTSLAARHGVPNVLPSVTSIPNSNLHVHNSPYFNGRYGGRGSRYAGWAYTLPYYYFPVDDSAYGYDYVGGGAGPELYSGPPLGPNDSGMHIIAEQPPGPWAPDYPPDEAYAPPAPPAPSAPQQEVKPGEPTVLVFRNGHQQEVTNYAIMGDSVWVFDQGSRRIALADVDVPATVKANDGRGLEFKVPTAPTTQKTSPTPQSTAPDPTNITPSKIAALTQ